MPAVPPSLHTADTGTAPPALGGRLHPAVIAVWPLKQAIGLVVLLIFGGAGRWGWIAPAVGVVVTVMYALVRWSRFTWALQGTSLVIQHGVFQRQRRVIPADRVQSVDLVSPLRHRLFGVVQVRVEAIGGNDTEGLLEALDRPTALALQEALVAARARARGEAAQPEIFDDPDRLVIQRPPHAGPTAPATPDTPPPAAPTPRVLARVTPRSLVMAGLTGGRVGVIAVLLGGAQQVVGDRIEDAIDLVPSDVGLVVGAVVVAVVAVVVFLLSVIATVVSYWDFTISRDAAELRISRGLLEQRLETIPIRRIQSLRIEQNLLRRWVGVASVKADMAGRAGSGDSATGLLLPIAPLAEAQRLVADLLGTDAPVHADLQPAAARSRRRWITRGLGAGIPAAVAGAGAILLGAPGWTPVAAAVFGAVAGVPLALAAWRAIGRGQVDGVVVATTGVLVRRRVHVPVGRVQRMSVQASPFQRRLGLADVHIGIARSGGWQGPRLLEVDQAEALALTAATVHQAVEASRRHELHIGGAVSARKLGRNAAHAGPTPTN